MKNKIKTKMKNFTREELGKRNEKKKTAWGTSQPRSILDYWHLCSSNDTASGWPNPILFGIEVLPRVVKRRVPTSCLLTNPTLGHPPPTTYAQPSINPSRFARFPFVDWTVSYALERDGEQTSSSPIKSTPLNQFNKIHNSRSLSAGLRFYATFKLH